MPGSSSIQISPEHSELSPKPVIDISPVTDRDDQDLDPVAHDAVDNSIVSRAPGSKAFQGQLKGFAPFRFESQSLDCGLHSSSNLRVQLTNRMNGTTRVQNRPLHARPLRESKDSPPLHPEGPVEQIATIQDLRGSREFQ